MPKLLPGLLVCLCSGTASAQNIQTIAGGGPQNLAPLQTGLAQPSGVAVDGSGSVYVALAQIHQIWKISTAGQVNVFAGNGSFPYNGDGISARSATLNQPQGLAFDAAGNLFVADSGHNRIRKVSTAGIITTVAGTGTASFSGDGGPGTAAQLNNPVGLAIDSAGNLYIADKNNHRVRLLNTAGTISTFAGDGVAQFQGENVLPTAASLNSPTGVAVNAMGSVYIADGLNFRVRKVDSTTGRITTFAGNGTPGHGGDGGSAVAAQLNTLMGITVDRLNNVYIVEELGIRAIANGSATITTFAGNYFAPGFAGDGGNPANASFRNLAALALDGAGQNAYIADAGNNRIRKATATVIGTFAGNGSPDYNGDGLAATSTSLLTPANVHADNAGSLFFADPGSSAIRKLNLGTGLLSTVAGNGASGTSLDEAAATGSANNPFGLTVDAKGVTYFVEQNRVRTVANGVFATLANAAGTAGSSGDGGPALSATFRTPSGLAVAANGDVYIADSQNNRVRVITRATGLVSTIAGNGTATSSGDGGLALNATLNYPSALSLDGAGNLFVGELLGNRVRKINLITKAITTAAGDGTTNFADGVLATNTGLSAPLGIFADQSSNLFIADQGHSRVRKVTAGSNVITTIAGNGMYDFSGDGGPAISAALNPLGVTVDRSQTLFIADSSGRIRTTSVTACFFALSSPNLSLANSGSGGATTANVNSSAATGTITVTATNPSCPYSVSSNSPFLSITSGGSGTGSGTVNFSIGADSGTNRTATLSIGGATVTVVQAGVFGQANVGYFQPLGGPLWVLDSNGSGQFEGISGGDKYFPFAGQAGAIAFAGDWNGDGRSKAGYYLNGFWVLDYNGNGVFDGADKFYAFGGSDPGYVPVIGDWNGDGRTKIGYYKNGFWVLDTNGTGSFEAGDGFFAFGGNVGETPIVGDWNGDKRSKIGYYFNGTWLLDYNGDGSFNIAQDKLYNNFTYQAGDKAVIGDWNGSGTTKIGVYRAGFWILDHNGNGTYDGIGAGGDKFFGFGGGAGDIPKVGDWNGDGRSKIGLYNSGFWTLDFNGNGLYDGTGAGGDRFIPFGGTAGNQPLIGRW